MNDDVLAAQLRQHLRATADERPAADQLTAIVARVAVTPQRPRVVAQLWPPARALHLPPTALRLGLVAALLAIMAAGALLVGRALTPPVPVHDPLFELLSARIAGEGAEPYLAPFPDPEDELPLLYATSSRARYDRGESQRLLGRDWPYGYRAYQVRMWAGDTVVEQLVFTHPDDPLVVLYDESGFGTEIPPTSEDGRAVGTHRSYAGGQVSLELAHPWLVSSVPEDIRLIPAGPDVPPTTDGGQRHDGWDRMRVLADPLVDGAGCEVDPSLTDAATLAERLRANPDLAVGEAVPATFGGVDALVLDIVPRGTTVTFPTDADFNPCRTGLLATFLSLVGSMTVVSDGLMVGDVSGDRMRLVLFDLPEGGANDVLAVAILAPDARFERAVAEAAPVLESIRIDAPTP